MLIRPACQLSLGARGAGHRPPCVAFEIALARRRQHTAVWQHTPMWQIVRTRGAIVYVSITNNTIRTYMYVRTYVRAVRGCVGRNGRRLFNIFKKYSDSISKKVLLKKLRKSAMGCHQNDCKFLLCRRLSPRGRPKLSLSQISAKLAVPQLSPCPRHQPPVKHRIQNSTIIDSITKFSRSRTLLYL